MARTALHDGLILSWATGTGKTLASIIWPILKLGFDPADPDGFTPNGKVLIIAPEGLHEQMREEYANIFGIETIELDSQETYQALKPLKHGWYLSSFTQIARNRVIKMPVVSDDADSAALAALMEFYGVTVKDAKAYEFKDAVTGEQVPLRQKALILCQKARVELEAGVGEERNGFRCVFSPALADYVRDEFNCVEIDEAVHVKAEESLIGIGCRSLRTPHRMLLTATAIKNRLPDIYFLAWWACGGHREATARWPYSAEGSEFERFQKQFLVMKRDLTKERMDALERGIKNFNPMKSKRKGVPTAEVANIHALWKLFAPVVLRRRKEDFAEIVPKVRHPIYVPLGVEQAKVYAYHLNASYPDVNGNESVLAKMQALRTCAAAPHSEVLVAHPQPDTDLTVFRSAIDYTPKVAAILTVIEQCLRRREQVAVGSALLEPLHVLANRLTEAGIPFYHLDGSIAPAKRGIASRAFKLGLEGGGYPVMLAGMESMAEGNNWFRCRNTVLAVWTWAFDLIEQYINRVHRMNSPQEVNVYAMICEGTIDRRLESLYWEKQNSQELVLDGKLIGDATEEINLAELLRIAIQEFADGKKLMDEKLCEAEWPALRAKLRSAYADILSAKPEEITSGESPLVTVANAIRMPAVSLTPYPITYKPQDKVHV
jgi:hypothetical protein